MIIGVSGKMHSGKDTVGAIIQYLVWRDSYRNDASALNFPEISEEHFNLWKNSLIPERSSWKIVKFADKLKDCVCIILGCTREQLEDAAFKNTSLGEEWIRYGKADGFIQSSNGRVMNNVSCSKEEYLDELRINWQTAYKHEHTPRTILQMLGTEVGRFIHKDTWVNATMRDYKLVNTVFGTAEPLGNGEYRIVGNGVYHGKIIKFPEYHYEIDPTYPDWIITDVRYQNEVDAIKDKGFTIRLNRDTGFDNVHTSETALDDCEDFKYIVDNNGSLFSLIVKLREILIREKIIKA